jgi:large subunit ribosomal protein L10
MNKDVLSAKQEVVKEIVSKAQASSGIIVAEYRGLTVAQTQELRRALAAEKASMNVYKNSLVERASDELGYADLKTLLEGPNAIFFSEDVSSGAKVLAKYAKRYGDSLNIKGGIFEGQFADKAKVLEVAKLPNKEGMLSMLLSCLQAPVRQFACTVKAVADAK